MIYDKILNFRCLTLVQMIGEELEIATSLIFVNKLAISLEHHLL